MDLIEFKKEVIRDKTGVEGGYVDNPNDLGKATCHGITVMTAGEYNELWAKYNWDGTMETMPVEFAYEVYDIGWWQKMHLDDVAVLSHELAEKMFDFGINAGRTNSVRSMQRLLNVNNRAGKLYDNIVADGYMGAKSISALRGYLDSNKSDGADKIAYALGCMQLYHYVDISEKRDAEANEEFTRGWINRCWRDAQLFFLRLGA